MSGAQVPGTLRSRLREALWIAAAVALYLLLSLVVLPRLGFVT